MDGIIPQLHEAARNNETDRTRDLLRRFEYAPQMAVLANGLTPAHVAALSGSLGVLKALIEFSQEDMKFVATAQDKQGLTVLHYAALSGEPDVVDYLLNEFGDSATIRNYNGGLAIHFAAGAGHLEVLRKLVTHSGAHLANDKDNTGTSPAYFSAQEGHLDCFKYLCIEVYADKLSRAGDGMTTLHGATQGGHFETVKWIVQQMGPNIIQDRSDDGASPVHFAAASGHDDILAYFLQQGTAQVLVDSVDNQGATPAHDAVEYGHLRALKILVQYEADLTVEDDERESPFSLAMKAPIDDPIYIFVKEFMRLAPSPMRPRHIRNDSEPASIVSFSDTSARHPKTSKQEATEIQQAANLANQILTHRTKHVREQQAAERNAKERQQRRRKESLQVAKNRLLAFDPSPQRNVHSKGRSRSQDNIFESSPIPGTQSDYVMPRMKHYSHLRHRPSAHRRPFGYVDTEDLLLDKFVTHGFGVPAPAMKNLKHAKRVDLSQVSELVKRRESIRTRKDVYLYRQKQLRRIKEQSMSKKKILKYEDIQKKLDAPVHVSDTFEPPAPPINPDVTHGGNKWDQYIETDSNPDSVDERYNIAAGIEYATLALLAPSCCSAFSSPLPEETFVALEGKRGQREKEIKLGKMKNRQRQVGLGGAMEEVSDQSDDPFTYDDIEARRRGWDETGPGAYIPSKKTSHFIGGDDVREPGNIISPKEKSKSKKLSVSKGLSSLRKKVSKYKQTQEYSDSNSSLVSYASDGDAVPEPDMESNIAESFDAPLFTPPARKMSFDSGQQPDDLTPRGDTPTQFKYNVPEAKAIRPKIMMKEPVFTPPPPLSESEIEPIVVQSSKLIVKEETVMHSSYSGVTRVTDSRRRNVSVPVKKSTPAVVTISNVLELPSGSDSSSSLEPEPKEVTPIKSSKFIVPNKPDQLIGQKTSAKPDRLIGQKPPAKHDQLIGQKLPAKHDQLIGQKLPAKHDQLIGQKLPTKHDQLIGQKLPAKHDQLIGQKLPAKPDRLIGQKTSTKPDQLIGQKPAERNSILSNSNDDLDAILKELDLIGYDLQLEIDGFSEVATPPTQSRKIPQPEPKVPKVELKTSKPELKAPKPEPKVPKPEPRVFKPEPTTSPNKIDMKQFENTFSQDKKSDKVSPVEPKGRARGGRTPGGLKLSYNAENNYPESDGSSIVSGVSKMSKQGSELQFQIDKHEKLVTQASTANQMHLDKQTELQLQLKKADDAIRKRSLSYEQAQMQLRKVSMSSKQPQVVQQARERADQSKALLEEAKSEHENIKEQLEVHVQQLSQLQNTLAHMIKFKGQQTDLLSQISKETHTKDHDSKSVTKLSEDTQTRRKPPGVPEHSPISQEDRVVSTQKVLNSSSEDDAFIPPAESWKLISSQTTATIQRISNTELPDNPISATNYKNFTTDLKSGQMTPRTLELTEATRGHISIASLKRKGDKRDSNPSEPIQHNLENNPNEPVAVRKKAVFHPKEEFCVVCQLRVYPTEKFIADGKTMHITCIKCSVCKRRLTSDQLSIRDHQLFCSTHLPT